MQTIDVIVSFMHLTDSEEKGSYVHLRMVYRCFKTLCVAQEIIYVGSPLQRKKRGKALHRLPT